MKLVREVIVSADRKKSRASEERGTESCQSRGEREAIEYIANIVFTVLVCGGACAFFIWSLFQGTP